MYKLEWRPTSAGWSCPFVDGDEVEIEAMKYAERCNELENALNGVLIEVKRWQESGRNGFCMPVLRGELLSNLEKLANETYHQRN